MATIKVAEDRLAFHYRITLTNGKVYTLHSEPAQPEVARDIYGSITDQYTFVGFMSPPSFTFPLLQGIQPDPLYLQSKLGIDAERASLLAAIASTLTLNPPAAMILEAVEAWEEANK